MWYVGGGGWKLLAAWGVGVGISKLAREHCAARRPRCTQIQVSSTESRRRMAGRIAIICARSRVQALLWREAVQGFCGTRTPWRCAKARCCRAAAAAAAHACCCNDSSRTSRYHVPSDIHRLATRTTLCSRPKAASPRTTFNQLRRPQLASLHASTKLASINAHTQFLHAFAFWRHEYGRAACRSINGWSLPTAAQRRSMLPHCGVARNAEVEVAGQWFARNAEVEVARTWHGNGLRGMQR